MVPAALLLWAICTGCAPDSTDTAWISADSLQVMMDTGKPLVLLDTRVRGDFEKAHLPGAVAASGSTVSQLRAVLPAEIDGVVVVVTLLDKDPSPPLISEATHVYGFRQVYRLRGGVAGWAKEGRRLDGHDVPGFRESLNQVPNR